MFKVNTVDMKIFIGADHAGFEMKEKIKVYLHSLGYETNDEGAFKFDPTDDYPDFIDIVAKMVASDPENHRGIIFGGSGQGEAICANRFKHVRAAVFYGGPSEAIKLSREHNNSNVLSLGARLVELDRAKEIIKLWLDTPFSGDDRHIRRIAKLDYKLKSNPEF